ncbi:MAG: twin-arginine translocase TatA/TatE family subunit [Ignavibacteria bacterium]|nr:twin-arginine translocase TatA/TatE family subunit [Ignavibacteria bacterium]
MFGLGTQELIFIIIVILILFGPKKIPELMQSLGKGLREFRKAKEEIQKDINNAINAESKDEGKET